MSVVKTLWARLTPAEQRLIRCLWNYRPLSVTDIELATAVGVRLHEIDSIFDRVVSRAERIQRAIPFWKESRAGSESKRGGWSGGTIYGYRQSCRAWDRALEELLGG